MPFAPDRALLESVDRLAARAAEVILRHYGTADARAKSDGSPVTEADHEAEEVILEGLAALTPSAQSALRRPGKRA